MQITFTYNGYVVVVFFLTGIWQIAKERLIYGSDNFYRRGCKFATVNPSDLNNF